MTCSRTLHSANTEEEELRSPTRKAEKVGKIERRNGAMRADYPETFSWKMTISSISSRAGHHKAQLGFEHGYFISLQRASMYKPPACGPSDLDIYLRCLSTC